MSWGYRAIADDIDAQIRAGERQPGDRLPSRNQLATEYDVNPSTVWRALCLLHDRGLLASRQGSSNMVAPPESWR